MRSPRLPPVTPPRFQCCYSSEQPPSSGCALNSSPPSLGLLKLFDNNEQREKVLGYTQAFSSFGGLMVAIMNGLILQWVKEPTWLPAIAIPIF